MRHEVSEWRFVIAVRGVAAAVASARAARRADLAPPQAGGIGGTLSGVVVAGTRRAAPFKHK